jgi:hypothetical protein
MRAMWKVGLSLALGLLANAAQAEEVQWRPVGSRPAVVKESTGSTPGSAPTAATPAAALGQPVAITPADAGIRPVSYSTDEAALRPTFRGQAPDVPKPMPSANGQDKSSDKGFPLPPPKEYRETLSPSPMMGAPNGGPPFGTPMMIAPNGGPPPIVDSGDYVVPAETGIPGCCGDGCFDGCCCGGCCGDGSRWWASAEYLLWWTRHANAPALATTGPTSTFGVLGAPGTVTLFDGNLNYGTASGGRFSAGYWFCDSQCLGIDASVLFLGERSINFLAASNSMGSPVISRPFVGAITGVQTVEQVAFPGEQAGNLTIHSDTRFRGAETNLRWNPCCLCGTGCCGGSWRIGFLTGFRYLNLRENLDITEDFVDLGAIVTRHTLTDQFSTRNNFYGGQVGMLIELKRGCWSLDMRGKIALGGTTQTAQIGGSELDTSLNTGAQARFNSGLLALPSNIGRFSRDQFSVVPEVGINIGYQVCEHLRLFVGYNFIYWNNVSRPGGLIDPVLNTTQQSGGTLVGPARPAFAFHNTDFWAHGVNFGLELRY